MKKIKRKIYNLSKDIGNKIGIDFPYYVENGFWVAVNQAIQIIVGIGLSVILARYTSEKVFGQYNFLLSILSILSIISMPGVNISLLRSIARNKHGTYKKTVKFSFLWSLAGVPVFLLLGVYYHLNDNLVIAYAIYSTAFFFPLIFPFQKWQVLLQGQSKFNLLTLYNSIKNITVAGFISASVFLGKDNIQLIFIAYLSSNTLINILFYYLSNKHIKNNDTDSNWKNSAYKLSLIPLISLIFDHADKVLLGVFFESYKLAIYSIAVSIIIYIRTAIKMLMNVVMPKLYKADKNLLRTVLRKFGIKLFFILIIASGIFYFFLPFIINILYTAKYESSIIYAQIYLISIPATGMVMFFQNYLIAFKAEALLIRIKLILAIFNLLLYFLLIPSFGIIGAVISSIIYYYLSALIFTYFAYKK